MRKCIGVLLAILLCCCTGCTDVDIEGSDDVATVDSGALGTFDATCEMRMTDEAHVLPSFEHEPVYRRSLYEWRAIADGVDYSVMGTDTLVLRNSNNYAISYKFRQTWFTGILYGHSCAVLYWGHTDLTDGQTDEWEISEWTSDVDTGNTVVLDKLRSGIDCQSFALNSSNKLSTMIKVEPNAALGNTKYEATLNYVFFQGNRHIGQESITTLFDTRGGLYSYTFDVREYLKAAQGDDIAFYMVVSDIRVISADAWLFDTEAEEQLRWNVYAKSGTLNDYLLRVYARNETLICNAAYLTGETVNGDFVGAELPITSVGVGQGVYMDIALPRNLDTATLQLHVYRKPIDDAPELSAGTVFDRVEEDEGYPRATEEYLLAGNAMVNTDTITFTVTNVTDRPILLTELNGLLLDKSGAYLGTLTELVHNYRILDVNGDTGYIDLRNGVGSVPCIIPPYGKVDVWILSYDVKEAHVQGIVPWADGVFTHS